MTRAKTGGRVRGTLDKGERAVLSAEMAGDLLAVYKKLGGVKWLLKFAQDNPAEFLKQGLSRLMPAPQKDDPEVQFNQQINVGSFTAIEAASRVAFALRAGIEAQQDLVAERVEDPTPQEACEWRNPTAQPVDAMPQWQPSAIEDPDRERWASELPLTPEERADQALTRETRTCTIENYAGSSAEHSGSVRTPVSTRKPSVRELNRRRRDLL